MIKARKFHSQVGHKKISTFLQELRSKAERLVKPQVMADLSKLNMDDIARLVHELETHQIELEMQNKELMQAQNTLEEITDEYTRLFNDAPVGLVYVDQKGTVLRSNFSAASMLGMPLSTISGNLFTSFIYDEDQDHYHKHQRQAITSLNRESSELRLKTATAEPFWIRLDSICDSDRQKKKCIRTRMVLIDINDQKNAEAELLIEKIKTQKIKNLRGKLDVESQTQLTQKQGKENILAQIAVHDDLTGVPNSVLMNEKADSIISSAQKQSELVGMILIHIDDLKLINESAGQLLGDVVIVETLSIIRDSVRACDLVGRWGSNKFLIILPDCKSMEVLEKISIKILDKAKAPNLNLALKQLKLSLGLALYPDHAETTTKLISHAEDCMGRAIKAGGNQYVSDA